ncbi:MAG: ABC transporter ATP-binding protein [Candidatus Micrarchaeia archaeon]|jgi:putative ABC transport system ATP-binding protein
MDKNMHTHETKTRNSTVLEFDAVSKEYSIGSRKLAVLSNINFKIHKSEFVTVMGPSGSGKSTMLQLMGCLDKPSSGRILVDGIDVSKLGSDELAKVRSQNIGFVFQAFNLLSNLSALENVEVAMSIAEHPKAERMERANALLEKVGLAERATHKPNELSGGEKQRVAIARALANNPAFLLADEPTGNLDSKSGKEVMELIRGLSEDSGTTIVVVTHEPAVALYGKRTILLGDGSIKSDGPTKMPSSHDIKLK